MEAEHSMRAQWPLVGRTALLNRMTASLRSPAASVVILCGASGVGKSRLATEAGRELADDGWFVATITASKSMAAIPLGAIGPLLTELVAGPAEAPRDPLALFDHARRSLETLAGGKRTVLIVDDVSHLDSLSLALLTQLLGAGATRMIATVRSGDPLPDAILSMWTSDSALRIDVPPLTVEEHGEVLAAALGAPVTHRSAVELHRLSGGNPLYLRELALGAVADGQLSLHDGVWQLLGTPLGTPALHDLIRSRIRDRSPGETAILERLALCQPLPLTAFSEPGVRADLVTLERTGIVVVADARGATTVSLAHPQYATAIAASLTRLQIIDLLLAEADRVASRPMTPEDELRVAIWRLDAGQPSDPQFLAAATRLAVLAQDHSAVARLAPAAITAGAPAAEMLFLHGEALWISGKNAEALMMLERAALEDEKNPTTEQLTGSIATGRASAYAGKVAGNPEGIAVLDAVVAHHPALTKSLALARAVLLLNLEEAALAAEILLLADPASESETMDRGILDLSTALPFSALGRTAEAVVAARAAVAYARDDPRPAFALRRAQMVLATVLLQAGEVEEAKSLTLDSLHDAIQHDDELAVRYDELMLGCCFLALGKLDTAARWFRDVISGSQARGPDSSLRHAKSLLAITVAWQGNTADAAQLLSELNPEFLLRDSHARMAALWVEGVTGNRAEATTALIELALRARGRGHLSLAAATLHAAARLGGNDLAAVELESIAGSTDCPLIAARAAHARAESSRDAPALAAVAAVWERGGNLLFAAEAYASAASAARRSGHARDAAGYQAKADAVLARCESVSTPLLHFSDLLEPLTPREREIAGLAAQGLSSIDIAARLFLSPRTVDNHLQAAYSKLGIRGRRELSDL